MTHGALFNGIGGFQLAAHWAGWDNVFSVEIDRWCNEVTAHHFPECKQFEDIYDFDGTQWAGQIDVLTGGFPCQPFSIAGKKQGTADSRHLWPEMLRIIQEVRPAWVVGENVLGIINWSSGLVFEHVHSDLEAEGFEVQTYCIPACSVGAPHKRSRVWIVAKDTLRYGRVFGDSIKEGSEDRAFGDIGSGSTDGFRGTEMARPDTNAGSKRLRETLSIGELEGRRSRQLHQQTIWDSFPLESPLCSGDDGISEGMDKNSFQRWRRQTIKAAGNAIVPQVAYQIFKSINQYSILK